MSDVVGSPLSRFLGSPGRVFAVIFAGVLALLAIFYFLALQPRFEPLYSDLRPADAAAVTGALEQENIAYRLSADGTQVLVAGRDLAAARVFLAGQDLAFGGLDGFEIFDETDMGLTDFAEKIRYQRALQGEIARTIMRLEGVREARVHISIPERALFRAERRKAEAAVTLVLRSPQDATAARIEGVQRLVAAAVPELDVADVVVLDGRGEVLSPRIDVVATAFDATPDSPARDLIVAVIRSVIPDQFFEVSIRPVSQGLNGDADGAGVGAASAANIVTLTTAAALSSMEMEQVAMALRRAGVVDGETMNTLAFSVGAARPRPAPTEVGRVERAEPSAPAIGWGLFAIGIAAILIAVIVGIRVRSERVSLSPDAQLSFAERLRELLNARNGAAP